MAYNLARLKNIQGEAVFSECKTYRYVLTRTWGNTSKRCNFIMMNPSTADEFKLDPTVRKCLVWAILWGYGELVVTNLFAYRSTDVRQIKRVDDPIGSDNDKFIQEVMENCKDGLIVCAFGRNGLYLNRHWDLFTIADKVEAKLHYLHMNDDNTPAHPLYLSSSLKPIWWDYKNAKAVDDQQPRRLANTRSSI